MILVNAFHSSIELGTPFKFEVHLLEVSASLADRHYELFSCIGIVFHLAELFDEDS